MTTVMTMTRMKMTMKMMMTAPMTIRMDLNKDNIGKDSRPREARPKNLVHIYIIIILQFGVQTICPKKMRKSSNFRFILFCLKRIFLETPDISDDPA